MRIAIFGTGGVGGYFGGRLAQAGEEVAFIARGEHLEAMRRNGLKVDSVQGDFVVDPVNAADNPEEFGFMDVVLVCVKAWHVKEAARSMRPLVGPQTVVVPLLNGVEAPDQLADVLGTDAVAGGLCGLISMIAGPGHICHAGVDPFVQFGELDNRSSQRLESLKQAFDRATGISAAIPGDIQAAMWRKFLMLVSWSGLGAITRSPLGAFLHLPETRDMLQQSMREILEIARARNIDLPEDVIPTTMTFMDNLPTNGTASMQRDIMAGRPSELESQTGAVVRLGREAGIPTPLNTFIYSSLLPWELKARGALSFEI